MDLIPLLRAALKTLAGLNPFTTLVVETMNEYGAKAQEEKSRRAAAAVTARLNDVAERIDLECVRSDEFVELATNCNVVMRRTQFDEKLRAAANILANAALRAGDPDKQPFNELDHFTRAIEMLSLGALDVLGRTIERGKVGGKILRKQDLSKENVALDFTDIHNTAPEMDKDLLLGCLGELGSFNLICLRGSSNVRLGGDEKKYSEFSFETTPLGYRFHKYVLEPKPQAK